MVSKMEFECKLAHKDEIKRISGFTLVKDLYEKICREFDVSLDQIMYCTLNTHDFRDMESLLGNYLSYGDLIVCHICGKSKELNFKKTNEYLGLTITDNGGGRAFVKKVKSNEGSLDQLIKPGDHIAAINGDSTIGKRHYEVAKAIRQIPQNTSFSMLIVEPLFMEKNLKNKNIETDLSSKIDVESNLIVSSKQKRNNLPSSIAHSASDDKNLESIYEDLTHSSLPIDQLLSKEFSPKNGPTKETNDCYRMKIDKINSVLESFLGINDNTLAIQIYRIAVDNRSSFDDFTLALTSSGLSVFNFSEDIRNYLWSSSLGSTGS